MAWIDVNVSIDIEDYLDEVSISDLIEELQGRDLSTKDVLELSKITGSPSKTAGGTLQDQVKLDIVMKGLDDKTISELEIFFNK